jgi:hypothetical protein
VTELGRVSGVQVDFVGPAVQCELDRLIGWPAGQVIFQLHVDSVHYFPLDDEFVGSGQVRCRAALPQDLLALSLSGPDL